MRRLGRGIQSTIRAYRASARAVSLALGYHAGQLTQVLNGHRPMRVKLVLEVLENLGAPPGRTFDLHYPLGGIAEAVLREGSGPAIDPPGTKPLREVVAELERAREAGPAETVRKLGLLLRRELRTAQVSQREVSRRLGLGEDALGKALRGDSELTFLHVFAVLAATGRSPARIFAELFAPTKSDPMEQLELARRLDDLEAHRFFLAERLLPAGKARVDPLAPRRGKPRKPKKTGRKKRTR